jgi:hypothetical protein
MNPTVVYLAFSFAALPFAAADAGTDVIPGTIASAGSLNGRTAAAAINAKGG